MGLFWGEGIEAFALLLVDPTLVGAVLTLLHLPEVVDVTFVFLSTLIGASGNCRSGIGSMARSM